MQEEDTLERFRKGWAFLFLAVLVAAMLGCRFSLEEEQETTLVNKTFLIDPPRLLELLANGDPGAFVLLTATPPIYPDSALEPVEWKQTDYFYTAEALYQLVQKQSLAGWDLKRMSFREFCHQIEFGFQSGGFTYFRSYSGEDENYRREVSIYIVPDEKIADLLETEYSPDLEEGNSIDLTQIKITADDALQIAEQQGGQSFRNSVNDECTVLALFDVDGKYEDWYVTYFSDDYTFKINIDASTGEYRIIRIGRY